MKIDYNHMVEIDKEGGLAIYRIYKNGRKELFTTANLPLKTFDEDKVAFQEFACMLGENLLMDSPIARALLDL